jgi:hypothetical protein
MNDIKGNLQKIYERVKTAAEKANRKFEDITIVAVSKTHPLESILEAYHAGHKVFGENKIQEALTKVEKLKDLPIHFHFIGHIQTNKVRYLENNFALIHSVDRISLAKEMDKRFSKINRIQDVLIQVNIAREEQKHGVLIENFEELLQTILDKKTLRLKGLMMIPPFREDITENIVYFNKMRILFEETKKYVDLEYLSMGMSDDFEIAIQEGSNMVRIGTKIFGKRG